jgi:hypothetical protein
LLAGLGAAFLSCSSSRPSNSAASAEAGSNSSSSSLQKVSAKACI